MRDPAHCLATHCRHGRHPDGEPDMSRKTRTVTLKLSALAAGMLFSGMSLADARIPADLVKTLASASAGQELNVIVTYSHSGAITGAELASMKSLGIDKGRT